MGASAPAASGLWVAGGGTKCQACSSIDPNCTTCAEGACSGCTSGFAVNVQSKCLKPGTTGCSYSVSGQCCQCQYSCLIFNPASGSCVGAPSDGCGDCQSRQ